MIKITIIIILKVKIVNYKELSYQKTENRQHRTENTAKVYLENYARKILVIIKVTEFYDLNLYN